MAGKKNILVTGGNGQLGRSLQKIAPEYPDCRFVFSDLPQLDIAERAVVEKFIDGTRADRIVNCAAYTAVDRAESDARAARRVNADGPAVLAGVAREKGIGLIHISTDYVFPGTGNRPLNEADEPDPQSVYGRTKREGEEAVKASGCDAAIVRTAWLYSEFGNNFVKTMLRVGKERGEVSVVYDQTGTPTYAEDLARAVLNLAERGPKGFGVYHYADEGAVSWYDFAQAVFELYGLDVLVKAIRTEDYPAIAPRPRYSVLSKEKIKAHGIAVPYWRESLRRCIETIKQAEK